MIVRAAVNDDWSRIWPLHAPIVLAGETYTSFDLSTFETACPLWMEQPPSMTAARLPDPRHHSGGWGAYTLERFVASTGGGRMERAGTPESIAPQARCGDGAGAWSACSFRCRLYGYIRRN